MEKMKVAESKLAQAATCSHLLRLLQPLAQTANLQVGASGCKWLHVAASGCGVSVCQWLQVAASARGYQWLQVAASDCKWLQVVACGCKWLQVTANGCK